MNTIRPKQMIGRRINARVAIMHGSRAQYEHRIGTIIRWEVVGCIGKLCPIIEELDGTRHIAYGYTLLR